MQEVIKHPLGWFSVLNPGNTELSLGLLPEPQGPQHPESKLCGQRGHQSRRAHGS